MGVNPIELKGLTSGMARIMLPLLLSICMTNLSKQGPKWAFCLAPNTENSQHLTVSRNPIAETLKWQNRPKGKGVIVPYSLEKDLFLFPIDNTALAISALINVAFA